MLDPVPLDRQGTVEDEVAESADREEEPVTVSTADAQQSSSAGNVRLFFIALVALRFLLHPVTCSIRRGLKSS